MRNGFRLVRLMLGICAVVAACAAPAQAYVYWAVGGPLFSSSGGTTLGRANLDGSGVTHGLVTGAANPFAIAVDANHIYWVNATTNSIGRSNLAGGGANPTWITLSAYPLGLALDATHIYWTDGSQYIGRANLDGTGANPTYIKTSPGVNGPSGIAVTSGTIYFGGDGEIASVPVTGGTPSTVTTLDANTQATAMAIAGGYLYWTSADVIGPPSSAIDRIQLAGAHVQNLNYIPNLWFPAGVATDGTYVYWTDDQPSQVEIGRALISSGSGATNIDYSFISEPGGPVGIAVDAGIDPTHTSSPARPRPSTPAARRAAPRPSPTPPPRRPPRALST